MARPIWTGDCETDPFEHGRMPQPFLWDIFDGAQHHLFENVADMIRFVADKRVIIYFHNGGKFDFHFLLEYLEPDEEIMIINGRLAKFQIGLCEFRDSFNILPVPLSAYQKTKIDYGIFEKRRRKRGNNWSRITEYLKDDCVFLFDLVQEFINRYGINLTQAGASMRQWQKINGKPPRSDKEFYDHFKSFYYGGRVECFESGDINEKFEVLDINSAYPYAMLSRHPYGLEYQHVKRFDIYEEDDEVITTMMFRIKAKGFGAFPYRNGNKLEFPHDGIEREFFVTGWELLAARDTDALHGLQILDAYYFVEQTDFRPFVERFYAEKLEAEKNGDKAGRLVAKLLMTGLYGKFAANPEKYGRYWPFNMEQIEYYEAATGRLFRGFLGPWALHSEPLKEEIRRYYNVATAASITGCVRAQLWRAIQNCERVLYCDTDSLAVVGKHKLPISQHLGHWESEGKFNRACIGGKKLYAFRRDGNLKPDEERWKVRSKGVRLTFRDVIKICNGGEVMAISDVPTYTVFKAPYFNGRRIRMTV